MKKLLLCLSLVLSSCTYSINMIHTEGEATDLIDEIQKVSPKTEIEIPLAT